MKRLLLLLFIALVSFGSYGQTKEIDKLRKIWTDGMFESTNIKVNNIDWDGTFVALGANKDLTRKHLTKLGIKCGTQLIEENENDDLLPNIKYILYGKLNDYDWKLDNSRIENYQIKDLDSDLIVGYIDVEIESDAYKNYKKAIKKYSKKNKRLRPHPNYVVWEEIIKRNKN